LLARSVNLVGRPRNLEPEDPRALVKPLGVLAKLEHLAVIGALPFEHRRPIMQRVGQHMNARIPPRDDLAVEPD